MAVLATDNFNRADNADLGANWTQQTGEANPFKILTNKAEPTNSLQDNGENYSGITWPNDQYSQVEISVTGTDAGTGPGVAVRMSSSARTYYRVVANHGASNNVEIGKWVAASFTQLGQRTQSFSDGAAIYLEAVGTTIIAKLAGTQLGASVTDAAIASGRAGINHSGSSFSASIDNWEGGTLDTLRNSSFIVVRQVKALVSIARLNCLVFLKKILERPKLCLD